jgi:hypothetical protein
MVNDDTKMASSIEHMSGNVDGIGDNDAMHVSCERQLDDDGNDDPTRAASSLFFRSRRSVRARGCT